MSERTFLIDGSGSPAEQTFGHAGLSARAWTLVQPWLPLFVLAGLLFAAWLATPGSTPWLLPCPFHFLTGLHCPGCGATRAFHALTHGNLPGALRMNSLAVAAIPFIVLGIFAQAWHARRGTPYRSPLYSPALAWTITTLIISYAILRNLPWWPFDLLAPH